MSGAAAPGAQSAERIVRALVDAKVEIATSLPDSWLTPLIARIDAEPAIRHVRVAREDDGVGICAGASLGGKRAVLVCQNAGLLLSANALAGYAHNHQLGFVVLAVYRGSHEDRFYYQMYKGLVTEPVLRGLRLPYHVVDRPDQLAIVADAVSEARLVRAPVVVLLRRAALFGEAR
ncbi:MAG TPA: thiamine pyrophosphate-binding protein [Candidatus Limnocylindria bacterium]|nr:thiamine pyrophosphate-binding protein [Candidatus Limnocylindria bacterium]